MIVVVRSERRRGRSFAGANDDVLSLPTMFFRSAYWKKENR